MFSKHRHSLYEVPEKNYELISCQWVDKQRPFTGIKFHEKEVNREFFDLGWIANVTNKKFDLPRIDLVRDIFIFGCYMGLSFIDIKQLTAEHIVKDREGNFWIARLGRRQRICVIFRYWIFLWLLLRNIRIIKVSKQNVLLPVPAIRKWIVLWKKSAICAGFIRNFHVHSAPHLCHFCVLSQWC